MHKDGFDTKPWKITKEDPEFQSQTSNPVYHFKLEKRTYQEREQQQHLEDFEEKFHH